MKIKNKRKENKMKKILQKIVYYNKIQKEDCKLSFFIGIVLNYFLHYFIIPIHKKKLIGSQKRN